MDAATRRRAYDELADLELALLETMEALADWRVEVARVQTANRQALLEHHRDIAHSRIVGASDPVAPPAEQALPEPRAVEACGQRARALYVRLPDAVRDELVRMGVRPDTWLREPARGRERCKMLWQRLFMSRHH